MYFYDEDGNCYVKEENGELRFCGNYYDHANHHAQAALDAEVEEEDPKKNRHWAIQFFVYMGVIFWTILKSVGYVVYGILWVVFKFLAVFLGDFLPFFLGGLLVGLGISEAMDRD